MKCDSAYRIVVATVANPRSDLLWFFDTNSFCATSSQQQLGSWAFTSVEPWSYGGRGKKGKKKNFAQLFSSKSFFFLLNLTSIAAALLSCCCHRHRHTKLNFCLNIINEFTSLSLIHCILVNNWTANFQWDKMETIFRPCIFHRMQQLCLKKAKLNGEGTMVSSLQRKGWVKDLLWWLMMRWPYRMSIEEMEGTIKSPAAASVHTLLLLWQSWQVTRVVYVCAPPGNGRAVFYDFLLSS